MKLKKIILSFITSALLLTACNKKGNIEDAKYLVLQDDGVPSHSALKGNGSKNYSLLLDKNGKRIAEYKEKLKEPYQDLAINKDYAYTVYGSPIKINLKTGKFERLIEKFENFSVENIAFYNNIAYYNTNESVNVEREKPGFYKSRIINEEGKEIWVGYSIVNISFNGDKLYIIATDEKSNYKLFETDKNLEKIIEVNDIYSNTSFIERFTIENDFFSSVVENNVVKKELIRIKDNKKFTFEIEDKFKEIFESGKDNVEFLFYNEENKNYLEIQVDDSNENIKNINELITLRGLYEINIDEQSQKISLKQVISLKNNNIPKINFYNSCVSIREREGVRLYDLDTGKEIFSVKNENAKAIIKLKK